MADILDLLSKGYTAPDIAGALSLSNNTSKEMGLI